MKSGVYEIINLVNGKRYVGSAVNLAKRRSAHFADLVSGTHRNKHLQRAFDKHGMESFSFVEFLKCDRSELLVEEQRRIDTYPRRSLYNIRTVASSSLGLLHSSETKRKMSKAHLGRVRTAESRRKLSEARSGMKFSQETRKRLSDAHVRPYPAFVGPDGTIHPPGINLMGFCQQQGLNQGSMRYVAIGARRQHKGWTLAPKLPT